MRGVRRVRYAVDLRVASPRAASAPVARTGSLCTPSGFRSPSPALFERSPLRRLAYLGARRCGGSLWRERRMCRDSRRCGGEPWRERRMCRDPRRVPGLAPRAGIRAACAGSLPPRRHMEHMPPLVAAFADPPGSIDFLKFDHFERLKQAVEIAALVA